MTRTMTCQRCGIEGEIEIHGMKSGNPSMRLFRHLGYNPVSGHLHYQCPACEIVQLVDPITILEVLISGVSEVYVEDTGMTKGGKLPFGESLLQMLILDKPAGTC